MSSLGKKIRLNRIFNPESGNMLIVAMDHPIAHGPIREILAIEKILKKIIEEEPEGIVLQKGIAARFFIPSSRKVALIVKLSSFAPFHPDYDAWLTTVEEAVSLGADAVSMGIHVGGEKQPELIRNVSLAAKSCDRWGMPLLVHAYPVQDLYAREDQKIESIMYAVRTAAELGADVVKTSYTGSVDTFRRVVEACPIPIGIAGGTKAETDKGVLKMIQDAMTAGAKGIVMGRNLWGRKNISEIMAVVKKIVHENATVGEVIKE